MSENRNTALLCLHFGIYNSTGGVRYTRSSPSLLRRSTVAPITPPQSPGPLSSHARTDQFFLALVSERVNNGRESVHDAWLEVCDVNGEHLKYKAIAKLAFSDDTKAALKNEYDVYQHLTDKGIKQIPSVLGLFNGPGNDVQVLLMTNEGEALSDRKASITMEQK